MDLKHINDEAKRYGAVTRGTKYFSRDDEGNVEGGVFGYYFFNKDDKEVFHYLRDMEKLTGYLGTIMDSREWSPDNLKDLENCIDMERNVGLKELRYVKDHDRGQDMSKIENMATRHAFIEAASEIIEMNGDFRPDLTDKDHRGLMAAIIIRQDEILNKRGSKKELEETKAVLPLLRELEVKLDDRLRNGIDLKAKIIENDKMLKAMDAIGSSKKADIRFAKEDEPSETQTTGQKPA